MQRPSKTPYQSRSEKLTVLILALMLGACSEADPPPRVPVSTVVVPMEIDDTTIFVPEAWGLGRIDDPRPWRNGVLASQGGWGNFRPPMGPLGGIGKYDWPKDGIFRASSDGQKVDPRNSFFDLQITFEFPLRPAERKWWGGSARPPAQHFSSDMLNLTYRAPDEEPMPYLALLHGLRPDEGGDVGDGWRAVTRSYGNRKLYIRFDAQDWREQGGALPRRLAVSYSYGEGIWDHHLVLSPRGWAMDFNTQSLPLSQWRGRHGTAEALYVWLHTPPAKRDSSQRFTWWEDIRNRPTN